MFLNQCRENQCHETIPTKLKNFEWFSWEFKCLLRIDDKTERTRFLPFIKCGWKCFSFIYKIWVQKHITFLIFYFYRHFGCFVDFFRTNTLLSYIFARSGKTNVFNIFDCLKITFYTIVWFPKTIIFKYYKNLSWFEVITVIGKSESSLNSITSITFPKTVRFKIVFKHNLGYLFYGVTFG